MRFVDRPINSVLSSRAVSLAETVIAIALLSILSVVVVQALHQISQAEKKMEMQEYVTEEAWRVLEAIENAMDTSTIDYEEYYSREVHQPQSSTPPPYSFGENYGVYHQQFFNPVTDYDTGQNPYGGSGYAADEANAFCPSTGTPNAMCSQNNTLYATNELFLIDGTGTHRTYFVLENDALSTMELIGSDTDEDGLIDTWACAPEYTCTGAATAIGTLPDPADLTDNVMDDINFKRLTPLNFSIDQLTFLISPLEDPFKGFNEAGNVFESVQQQPKVTIVLQAHYQLFDGNGDPIPLTAVNQYIGEAASIQLQTTFSSEVYHVLPAYAP